MIKLFTADLLENLLLQAGSSARRRSHCNVHESLEDPIQRLFIAVRRESYFRPHCHREKWEFALVLRGLFALLLLNEGGVVTDRIALGPETGAMGFEIPRGVWHAWVPMADESLFFEVKPGPYQALSRADFASWSPEEGSVQAARFLENMREARIGDRLVIQSL